MKKLKFIAPILIAAVCLGLQQAKADTIASYTLGIGNSAISGYPKSYGNVTVTLNTAGTQATIQFNANATGGFQYLFGGRGSVAVNVNGSFMLGSVTGTQLPGFRPWHYIGSSSGKGDGFGNFNLQIKSFGGYARSANQITFTVTNTSGTWANAASVLAANNRGFFVAAHIFVTDYPADPRAKARATGFAGSGAGSVPDGGATVMLLGAALGVLGMARRFLRS